MDADCYVDPYSNLAGDCAAFAERVHMKPMADSDYPWIMDSHEAEGEPGQGIARKQRLYIESEALCGALLIMSSLYSRVIPPS